MDIKAVNFVLEFAKDLQKLLETLEKEYGNMLLHASAYYKKKIQERASELTEVLYDKYKNILDLEIERGEEGSNIIIASNSGQEVEIPSEFINSKKYSRLKKELTSLIFLTEQSDPIWEIFSLRLIKFIHLNMRENKYINLITLEKLRFFSNFLNINPFFDFNSLPNEFNFIKYRPKYMNWRKNSSYKNIYQKYILSDKKIFSNTIHLQAIPFYPAWNLDMIFIDSETLNKSSLGSFNYYPIQVFEDYNGSIIGIIALISSKDSFAKKIENFTITNNLNCFKFKEKKKKDQILVETNSIFDSFVEFLDEKERKPLDPNFFGYDYNLNIDFTKKYDIQANLLQLINRNLINQYNLLYYRDLSNFIKNFLLDTKISSPSYRYLFRSKLAFPDLYMNDNYLFIINKKRRNVNFENLISFLKNWTYQTIVFELKNEYIIFGNFQGSFNYASEIVYINELFEQLNINYKFMISERDFKTSNLSIFTLPSSNQFKENSKEWELDCIKFPINICDKKEIFSSQLKLEKKLLQKYYLN